MEVKFPCTQLWVGKTNSGKTTTFLNLFRQYNWKQNFDLIYVISPVAHLNHEYDHITKYILSDLDQAMDKIMKLKTYCEKQKSEGKRFRLLIILEDSIGLIDFSSKPFCNLFATARHINMSFVIMLQQLTRFSSPSLRSNLAFLFIKKISDNTNLDCLYGLAEWESKAKMKQIINKKTANYGTIMIDKLSANDDGKPKFLS